MEWKTTCAQFKFATICKYCERLWGFIIGVEGTTTTTTTMTTTYIYVATTSSSNGLKDFNDSLMC